MVAYDWIGTVCPDKFVSRPRAKYLEKERKLSAARSKSSRRTITFTKPHAHLTSPRNQLPQLAHVPLSTAQSASDSARASISHLGPQRLLFTQSICNFRVVRSLSFASAAKFPKMIPPIPRLEDYGLS